MKRVLGIALPLLLVAACTTDESDETTSSNKSAFTAGYDLGTQVVLVGNSKSVTNSYVELDGTVTQVDYLDQNTVVPNTNAVCQPTADKHKTVSTTEVTTVTKTRIAGRQTAWILPGNYGNAGVSGENGTNVWGDPSNGWLFVTEPDLNILLSVQSAGAGDNRHLTQYLKTRPVNLYVFENDMDSDSKTMTTTTTLTNTSNVVTLDETTGAGRDRSLTTYGRYDLDNYVWQTGNLNGLYQAAPVAFNASLVVPSDVQVGDTWVNNGGSLMSAVGYDVFTIGGKRIKALHVIERGATDVDLSAKGIAGWCINYYTNSKDNFGEQKSSEATDLCDGTGAFAGLGADQVGTGWINSRHTWYYKGLPVKIEQETVDVSVSEWGYATPNTNGTTATGGSLPVGIDNGAGAGQCAVYNNQIPLVLNTARVPVTAYKPYAAFSVMKTVETWMATEIKEKYTIAKEYAEAQKAQ